MIELAEYSLEGARSMVAGSKVCQLHRNRLVLEKE